jgi:quercetin dioxygenase-like cupin family protein
MLSVKPLENLGDIKGAIYEFTKAGDILPKHIHDETSVHITIVAKGSIKAYSHDWEVVVEAGKCIDFPPNQPHEFMALEDDTRIFNIIKKYGGEVNDYTPVPQE